MPQGRDKQYASLKDFLTVDLDGLKGIFDDLSNGVSITDEHSTFIYANPAFTEITGYDNQEVIGENPGILHSGKHEKSYYKKMWEEISTIGRWQGEIWNRRKSGEIYPEILTITRLINNKNKIYYLAIFTDISVLELENKQRINLALRDPLTKLCNRTLLEEKFSGYIGDYTRSQFKKNLDKNLLAVLFIDINKFKSINDTYGHLAGDDVLINIAEALVHSSRRIDTIARHGGDEFAALLPKVNSKDDVKAFCQRVKTQLEQGIMIQDNKIIPAISIGVSFYPSTGTDYGTLIQQADKAMYYSKKSGIFLTFYDEL